MKKLIDHDLIDLTMIPPPMTPDEVIDLTQNSFDIIVKSFMGNISTRHNKINILSFNNMNIRFRMECIGFFLEPQVQ